MKKYYFLLLCFLTFSVLSAQETLSKEEQERREKNIQAGNPFAKFGYKAKVATLSKGKYLEVHDLDSIVTIGSIRYHVDKNEIVGTIVIDTTDMYARPIGDTPSRWLSPDPLSEEFPEWSPYTFVFNNPLKYTDPTGMAPEECCPDLVNAFKGIYGSVKSEVVGTYNFVTSDAYKSETWKGAGNMLLGSMAMSGPAGNIGNAYALDAQFGTNSVGAVQGMTASMESFGNDLTSGDVQKTAGAITTAALMFAPSKLDDVAKLGKVGKADFIVTPDGVAVPKSQSVMKKGFDNAGFPKKNATQTSESGSIYTVPTKNGKVDVRTMDGSSKHPKRAVITHPNTNSPKTPSGKATTNKKDNHIEQH